MSSDKLVAFAEAALHQGRRLPPELPRTVVWLLALYALVRGIVESAARPLFFDEILTWTIASQPGLKGVWEALRHALDGQPPVYYLVEKAALAVFGNTQVALRLPSVMATSVALICIYSFVRRRYSGWVALACAMLLMLTSLWQEYAANARPYALLVAGFACALLCYQRLPSWRLAILLGLSLAFAESIYYYSILGLFPFACAEAVVLWNTRRIRLQAWLALVIGAMPLIPFWPLLAHMRAYYGAHYWVSKPTVSSIAEFYGEYLLTNTAYGGAAVAVLLAGMMVHLLWRRSEQSANDQTAELGEDILVVTFLLLPVVAFIGIKLIHGVMLGRYVLEATLGMILVAGCMLSRASRGVLVLSLVFIVSSVGITEYLFWRFVSGQRADSGARAVEKFLGPFASLDLPVVIADGIQYLPLEHYASPVWAKRFVFVGDPELAVKYAGTDSVDKNVLDLRTYANINVEELTKFSEKHPEFLLYKKDDAPSFSWITDRLSEKPWSLKVLKVSRDQKLYLVTSSSDRTKVE